jgi:CRISPR-associated exonuclease Cas4
MEHTSDLVYEGKLVHENSYPQRPERYEEVEIGGCKIDYYDARNRVVHEIKKSDKMEEAHVRQVQYYILTLERHGIEGVSGLLEYPALRRTTPVTLTDEARRELIAIEADILSITASDQCPPLINSKICRNCSYYEFCFVRED